MSNDEGEDGIVTVEGSRTMRATTATVTVEVEDDGHLTDEERRVLADALLEEGQNTDYADWDDSFPVPTVRGRSI